MIRIIGVLASILAPVGAESEPIHAMSPAGIDAYLEQLQSKNLSFSARLAQVVNRSLGTPYFNGPLGEGPAGKYDQDPLVDFSRV